MPTLEDGDPISSVVAHQARSYREKRGLSQQDLSNALGDIGVKASQGTIALREQGRRGIGVDDVFALAVVLDVAPVHLLIPRTYANPVELAPAVTVSPRTARAWVQGRQPLGDQDATAFYETVSDDERLAQYQNSVRALTGRVRELVSATIRAGVQSDEMADAIDRINTELDVLDG